LPLFFLLVWLVWFTATKAARVVCHSVFCHHSYSYLSYSLFCISHSLPPYCHSHVLSSLYVLSFSFFVLTLSFSLPRKVHSHSRISTPKSLLLIKAARVIYHSVFCHHSYSYHSYSLFCISHSLLLIQSFPCSVIILCSVILILCFVFLIPPHRKAHSPSRISTPKSLCLFCLSHSPSPQSSFSFSFPRTTHV
jgi:hypothetical protein